MKYKTVQVIDHKATGAYWREVRIAKGVSLRGLARHMGLSAPYLGDLERGRRGWSAEKEERYREALEEVWIEGTVVVEEEDWPEAWPPVVGEGEVLASIAFPEEWEPIAFSLCTVPSWYTGFYTKGIYRGDSGQGYTVTFHPDQVHSWKYTEVIR